MKKTRFIPYGYTMRDGHTVIQHDEADIIRYIFRVYINGASLKEIAEELTQQKVPYTEKTNAWDKARIARIIENARYTGSEEYDPIIDESIYEKAVAAKSARQRNQLIHDSEAIALLRNRVKCQKCGYPMARSITSKRKTKERWTCTNDDCGFYIRISDSDLTTKINIIMNRIIANTELLIPRRKQKAIDSPLVAELQNEIDTELQREHPSETFILSKIGEIATQLYAETNSKAMIAAQVARKRAMLMKPQESFNCEYFSDLVESVSIGDGGQVTLLTKTGRTISEGDTANGSNENTEEENYGH